MPHISVSFSQSVERLRVPRRGCRYLRERQAAQRRDLFRDVAHKRRLVALAAHRHRRHVGRVRLDEQALERHIAHDLGELRRVLECERPVDAEVEPQTQELARHLSAARVAVKDSGDASSLALQDGERIGVRLAVVDADGQVQLAREVELADEDAPL